MFPQFFFKKFLTIFLAVFLVFLSVANGHEVKDEFSHDDFQVAEVLYDYVDFHKSRVRNNTLKYSSLQRIADDNSSKFEFGTICRKLFSESRLKKITQIHAHPQITHLVKVVVCKNAP